MKLEIHIYNSFNSSLDFLLNSRYISSLEKHSFEKYKNVEVKKEKIVSAIFKNKYVGDYYINEYGKPLAKSCYFNISHSHGCVVFIKDDVPVGIDIEKNRNASNELINYIANEEEKKYIDGDVAFYEIWTNKEALVKAYGTGIKDKPKDITALPINDKRIYKGKIYFNKTIKYNDYIITVSRQENEDFDLDVIEEII